MSLLNDHEVGHLQLDANIWNDNGGNPKAARKNIRLILKSGKAQLGAKHTAFEKSSSSSSTEAESPPGIKNELQGTCTKEQEQLPIPDKQQGTYKDKITEDSLEIKRIRLGFPKKNPEAKDDNTDGKLKETYNGQDIHENTDDNAGVDCSVGMDVPPSQITAEYSEEFKVTSSTDLEIPESKQQSAHSPDLGATSAIDAIKSSYGDNNSSPTESDHGDFVKNVKVGRSSSQSGDPLQDISKYSGEKNDFLRKMSPDTIRDFQKWYGNRRSSSFRESRYKGHSERYRDRSGERRGNYKERRRSGSRNRRGWRGRSRSKERQRDRWRSRSRDFCEERRRGGGSKDIYRVRERSRDTSYRSESRDREMRRSRERKKYTSAKSITSNREGQNSSLSKEIKTHTNSALECVQSSMTTDTVYPMVDKKRTARNRSNSSTSSGSSSSICSGRSPAREIHSKNDRKPEFKKLPNPDEVLKMRSSPKVEIKVCDKHSNEEASDGYKVSSCQVWTSQEASKEIFPGTEFSITLSSTTESALDTNFSVKTSDNPQSSGWLFPRAANIENSESVHAVTLPCSSPISKVDLFNKGSPNTGFAFQTSAERETISNLSLKTLPTLSHNAFTPSFIPVLPNDIGPTALKPKKSPSKSAPPGFPEREINDSNIECYSCPTHEIERDDIGNVSTNSSIRMTELDDSKMKHRKSKLESDEKYCEQEGEILSNKNSELDSEKFQSGNMVDSSGDFDLSNNELTIENEGSKVVAIRENHGQPRKKFKKSRAGNITEKKQSLIRRSDEKKLKRNIMKLRKKKAKRYKVHMKKSKHKYKRKKPARRRRRYSTSSTSSSSCSCCSSSSSTSSSSSCNSTSRSSSSSTSSSSASSSTCSSSYSDSSDSTSESSDESTSCQRRRQRRRRVKARTRVASCIESPTENGSDVPDEGLVSNIPLEMKSSPREKADDVGYEGDHDEYAVDGDNIDDLILEMNLAENESESDATLGEESHNADDDVNENGSAKSEKITEKTQPHGCCQKIVVNRHLSEKDTLSNKLYQEDKDQKPSKLETTENEKKSFGEERLTSDIAVVYPFLSAITETGQSVKLSKTNDPKRKEGESNNSASLTSVYEGKENRKTGHKLNSPVHPKEESFTKSSQKHPSFNKSNNNENRCIRFTNSVTPTCAPTTTSRFSPERKNLHEYPSDSESNRSEPLPPGVDTALTEQLLDEVTSVILHEKDKFEHVKIPESCESPHLSVIPSCVEKYSCEVKHTENKQETKRKSDSCIFGSDNDDDKENDGEKSKSDGEDLIPPGVDEADYWRTVLIESKSKIPRFTPCQVIKSTNSNQPVVIKTLLSETENSGRKEDVDRGIPLVDSRANSEANSSKMLGKESVLDVSKEIALAKQIAIKVAKSKDDEPGKIERIVGSSENRTFNRYYMRGVSIYGYRRPYSRSRSRSRSRGRSKSRDRDRRSRKRSRSRDRDYYWRKSQREYSPSSPTGDSDEKSKSLRLDQGKGKDGDRRTRPENSNGPRAKEGKGRYSTDEENIPKERSGERDNERKRRSPEDDRHSRHHLSRRHSRDLGRDRYRDRDTIRHIARDRPRTERHGSSRHRHKYEDKADNR